uniref:Uncharacterized protein n=1 Tax=Steinernema glaseri TaxID=37863 RepID=A0A1I7ZXA0_9BILA
MQLTSRQRYLESLDAKEEIARSFLRQREFRERMDDDVQVEDVGRILKSDIDAAHMRRLEEVAARNPREIREEHRWMDAVRNTTFVPRTKPE